VPQTVLNVKQLVLGAVENTHPHCGRVLHMTWLQGKTSNTTLHQLMYTMGSHWQSMH
jgi:hypothetical protein